MLNDIRSRTVLGSISLLLATSVGFAADPWAAPGDVGLRHDLELLADEGVLRSPVTTWPVSWPDVARDVSADLSSSDSRPEHVRQALWRVSRRASAAAQAGYSGIELSVAAAEQPTEVRRFADSPREEGEIAVGTSWMGERLAGAVRLAWVLDPLDGQDFRLDGSYVGVTAGNFMFSVGFMERWWGPGWDGSLILSTNARPMPTFTVERKYTDASKWPILRWLGPWRASLAVGEASGTDLAVDDVRFLAARINFKPRPWLEFGLSRTAQWCGTGRPCGTDTLIDLLLGRDNRDESLSVAEEPGNQMAGYDFRLRSPWRALPVALYGQFIGEDEAGGLPSKFLGLVGAEVWGALGSGSWRAHLEFADTACTFTREVPQFNCAYRNSLYPQGYANRGRIIGHSLDNDGRLYTLGAVYAADPGSTYSLTVQRVEANRDGLPDPQHALSPSGIAEWTAAEVTAQRDAVGGHWSVGMGYDDAARQTARIGGLRGFVRYSRGF